MNRFEDRLFITDDKVIIATLLPFAHSCLKNSETGEYSFEIPTVAAAIEPVEGEGYVLDTVCHSLTDPLTIYTDLIPDAYRERSNCYHKRVLNIVTTRAELRDIVGRCEG